VPDATPVAGRAGPTGQPQPTTMGYGLFKTPPVPRLGRAPARWLRGGRDCEREDSME
jgi:hypothetical protein